MERIRRTWRSARSCMRAFAEGNDAILGSGSWAWVANGWEHPGHFDWILEFWLGQMDIPLF
jgi:hypothetical protein